MNQPELLSWLRQEQQQWEALLERIGPARMEQPGVNGDWSMKDIVVHLTGWQRKLNAELEAARRGDPKPPPPWPAQLQTEDEINGWIYASSEGRPASEVVDESHLVLQQIIAFIEQLPDDVRLEQVHHEGRDYHLLWLGDRRFQAGEFFDHYHDDHEADVQAWLAGETNRDR